MDYPSITFPPHLLMNTLDIDTSVRLEGPFWVGRRTGSCSINNKFGDVIVAYVSEENARQLIQIFEQLETPQVTHDKTFEQEWISYQNAGYQYGEEALELVRFGWEIATGKVGGGE